MTVNINIDNRTIIRVLIVVISFFFAISFLNATRSVLTLIVISAFLAMALNPPVSYLSSKMTGGSRGLATGIAYLTVVGIISLFAWAIVPPLVSQTREFVRDVPSYIDDLANGDDSVATFVRENDIDDELKHYVDDITNGTTLGNASDRVFAGLGRIGAGIASVLTVLVLTFFMLVEGPIWLNKLWDLQPDDKRDQRKQLGNRIYQVVTGYVNGQLLIAFLAALASLIMILIVGLPLPLPLAGLVGLFGLIPLIGATLGSVVVILVALTQSIYSALAMLLFFLVYQQIENTFIQPYIQSKTLDVSPLMIFIAVLFGISIGGLLGAFIAIPAAAVIKFMIADAIEMRKSKRDSVKETASNKIKKAFKS